jgi:transcriptional regulator with XRE-family HTH domain
MQHCEGDFMPETFGSFIKKKRLEKDLSLRNLGDITGLDYSYIGRLEKGTSLPSRDTVIKLAKALGIAEDELLIKAGYHPFSQDAGSTNRLPTPISVEEQIKAMLRLDPDLTEEEKQILMEDMMDYFEYRRAKLRAQRQGGKDRF